jgi:hypothetical protein
LAAVIFKLTGKEIKQIFIVPESMIYESSFLNQPLKADFCPLTPAQTSNGSIWGICMLVLFNTN